MSALARTEQAASLPSLIDEAASALAGARNAAELLEAQTLASVAYDAAKRASRLATATKAHDSVKSAALRAQANANELIAGAQRRLADEWDAAQASGDVAEAGRPKTVSVGNDFAPATSADLGISRKDIHDARMVRDAEEAKPGVVRDALDAMLARGQEPTRAALNRELRQAANRPTPAPASRAPRLSAGEAFARFIEIADELEAIGARDLLAAVKGQAPQRAQLGQRASGLADLMEDITEGLANA